MQRLSFILVFFLSTASLVGQNPHGEKLKLDCKACHNSGGWDYVANESLFTHSSTGFELDGQHANTDCKACHENLIFDQAENDCIACHTDLHSMSVGNDCARCHNTTNWLVDNIPELHEENGFPLIGAHRMADCSDCHQSETGLRWDRIGNDCATCHMQDFSSAQNPNHSAAGFSTECTECHDPFAMDWSGGNFHFFFPLAGAHDIQTCASCHQGNDYYSASSECSSCHMDDFNQASNPNHISAGFSTNCTECHDPNSLDWGSGSFHLDFPLVGVHNVNDCAACHDVSDYNDISSDCAFCHMDDFNQASNPNHISSGFSTNCTDCHDPNSQSWSTGTFHLNFPLVGVHNVNDCAACHDVNDYTNISPDCAFCHMNDFNQATDPNHILAGFSTNCTDCHDPNSQAWGNGNFHNQFPLTGVHNINDCAACHDINNFPAASSECVSCHLSDFNQVNSPNHVSSGFSQDCLLCHTINGWTPADFSQHDNDYFPIYSGKHDGEWNACTDCHTTAGNYTLFSCIDCHEHDNPTQLANEHNGVPGYQYNSQACFNCHPDGED